MVRMGWDVLSSPKPSKALDDWDTAEKSPPLMRSIHPETALLGGLGQCRWARLSGYFPWNTASVSSCGRKKEEKDPSAAIAAPRAQPLSKCRDLVR